MMPRLRVAVLAGMLALLASGQNPPIQFDRMKPEVIQQRLETVKRRLRERRETLEALFREAGCEGDRLTTQKVPRSSEPNVLCRLDAAAPGAGDIVVGAHFDIVDVGMGVVDDWSGAALLPSLYQSLQSRPHKHRFVFIGFAGEETGLYGSRQYVAKLSSEEREATRAMINLECLGTSPPKVWASRADKRLFEAYQKVAVAMGIAPDAVNVEKVGDDDSHPFLNAKIPVLTIHSIVQETLRLLHSSRDTLKAVNPVDYYTSYRLTAAYLAYLDSVLE